MRTVVTLLAAVVALAIPAPMAPAQTNGAAITPHTGWSSWSFIRSNPTEADIEAQAKAMHDKGLVAHGYSYINIDDYYYLNPATTVDQYGRWVVDPARFPHGMSAVAAYVHGLGEKFGTYLTPGIPVAAYDQNTPIEGTGFHARDIVSDTSKHEVNYNSNYSNVMYYIDFAKNPAAAQAFLNSWADQLASWGVDYLKLDGVGDWDVPDVQHWSQALNQTGRTIHFELSNSLDIANAATWRQYANGWRVDGDIECYCSGSSFPLTNWNNVAQRFGDLPNWADHAGRGGWNDPDSLEIGNGADTGLTLDERRTQLTLWAIAAAPLVLGSDLTQMDNDDLALLTNDEVMAVDQRGNAARPVDRLTQRQTWATANPDGSYTVALFNLTGSAATVTARWSDLGFSGSASVRDLWSHTELGTATDTFSSTLAAHASKLLKVVPSNGFHYTAPVYNLVNRATGKYLDTDGTTITQQSANSSADQQWQLVSSGADRFKLVNRGSLLTGNGSGAQLTPRTDDGTAKGQWTFTGTDSGYYDIVNSADGQVAAGTSDSSIIEATASGGTSQQWQLVPAPTAGTQYKLVNLNSGGRMDVDNDSTSDGAKVLQWEDNGQTDQLWTLNPVSAGIYTITNVNSGKLLNIPGPTTAQGTQLIQWHDDGGTNSRWRLVDAGPGRVQIVSVYDNQVLDVSNNSLADGGAVIQFPSHGADNQRWKIVSTR